MPPLCASHSPAVVGLLVDAERLQLGDSVAATVALVAFGIAVDAVGVVGRQVVLAEGADAADWATLDKLTEVGQLAVEPTSKASAMLHRDQLGFGTKTDCTMSLGLAAVLLHMAMQRLR